MGQGSICTKNAEDMAATTINGSCYDIQTTHEATDRAWMLDRRIRPHYDFSDKILLLLNNFRF